MTNPSELTKEEINKIKKILQTNCVGDKCISRAKIYDLMGGPNATKMEKYKFEREVSSLFSANEFPGFTLRTGRGGGAIRIQERTSVTLRTSNKEFSGSINIKDLNRFIKKIQ
jgi:hypothetical protein